MAQNEPNKPKDETKVSAPAPTTPDEPVKDPKDMTPAEVSAKGAAAPPKGPSVLVLTHGSYTGPGCPDATKRKLEKDLGFNYDHDHPAQHGELVRGLGAHEVKRMLASKAFKLPQQVVPDEVEAE